MYKKSWNTDELNGFINMDVVEKTRNHINDVADISYGKDSGCGYKNDIFVSFACREEHIIGKDCLCSSILNQENLKDVDIDLELAEKIAIYVAGLLGGNLQVYRG